MTEPRAYEDNVVAFVDNTLPHTPPPPPVVPEPAPPRRDPRRGPHHDVPVVAPDVLDAEIVPASSS